MPATRRHASEPASKAGGYSIDPSTGHLGVTLCHYTGDGVRIEAAHSRDLIAKSGLKAGDVITAINGKAVTEHDEALNLLCSFKTPFSIEATPCPEVAAIIGQRDSAMSAAQLALKLCAPAAMTVGSIEMTTKGSGVAILLTLAYLYYAMQRPGPNVVYACRVAACLAFFACLFALVSSGQEVRRCAFSICDYPTMYGTEADCRSVCSSMYAPLHWPAVAASVLAVVASGRAAFHFVSLVDSLEAMPMAFRGRVF